MNSKEALDILNDFILRGNRINSEQKKKINEYCKLIEKDLELLEKIRNKDTRMNALQVASIFDYKDRALYYIGYCPICGESTTVLAWQGEDTEERCSHCGQLLLFKSTNVMLL